MAVTIYTNEYDELVDPQEFYRAYTVGPSDRVRVWPYHILGGVRALYNQRCVDTVTGEWTAWATYYQDIYGNEYPGAGFDFATYKVESIIHDREQV